VAGTAQPGGHARRAQGGATAAAQHPLLGAEPLRRLRRCLAGAQGPRVSAVLRGATAERTVFADSGGGEPALVQLRSRAGECEAVAVLLEPSVRLSVRVVYMVKFLCVQPKP